MALHRYPLRAEWMGDRGTSTSGYREYARDVTLRSDGKPDLLGSADVPFHGDASRWNPEELLLAALSQCHPLSYLHVAVTHGVVVTARHRSPGVRGQRHDGAGRHRRPLHRGGAPPDRRGRRTGPRRPRPRIHAEAGDACFIASSVAFPVRHEPVTRVAT